MKKTLPTRISIFLFVDEHSIFKYYNSHDLAPLYNRQLSLEFQEYLKNSVASVNRGTVINYKLICKKESDQKFIKPILISIRRHFNFKRTAKEQEYEKFKKRNYLFLAISFLPVLILQGAFPLFLGLGQRIHSVFNNAIIFFSWMILWKPVERLIFYRSPFKKEILLLKKMETAESIVIINEKEFTVNIQYSDAA